MSSLLKASVFKILLDYEGPEILVCKDNIGSTFLAVAVEESLKGRIFHAIRISNKKLKHFQAGKTDLLDCMQKPETGENYFFEYSGGKSIVMEFLNDPVPEKWLPGAGFFLPILDEEQNYTLSTIDELEVLVGSDSLQPLLNPNKTILHQAKERNSPVLYLDLAPEESALETKVRSDKLADFLKTFSSFLKYIHKKTVRDLGLSDEQLNEMSSEKYSTLDVFGFSAGSFCVQLQTREQANLFGDSEVEAGLTVISKLFACSSSPADTLEYIQNYKGHSATAYTKLLELIIKHNTPIELTWAVPSSKESRHSRINVKEASVLFDYLTQEKELGNEHKTFIGKVLKADTKHNKWTIQTSEGEFSGELAANASSSLSGITVDGPRYKFTCEEKLEEVLGTGRDKVTLYLVNYELIGDHDFPEFA